MPARRAPDGRPILIQSYFEISSAPSAAHRARIAMPAQASSGIKADHTQRDCFHKRGVLLTPQSTHSSGG
jgi:hypothetical protein